MLHYNFEKSSLVNKKNIDYHSSKKITTIENLTEIKVQGLFDYELHRRTKFRFHISSIKSA